MTSRDRVLAAFAHEPPDRVPRWCGAFAEFIEKAKLQLGIADTEGLFARFGDDHRRVHARYAGPAECSPDRNLAPGAGYRTPFGIERHGFGYGMPMTSPLAGATLAQIHAYPWPDPTWQDVARIRADALAWDRQYAIDLLGRVCARCCRSWHPAVDTSPARATIISWKRPRWKTWWRCLTRWRSSGRMRP